MGNNTNSSESHQESVSNPQQKKEVIKESSRQSFRRKSVNKIRKKEIKYELNIYLYSNLDQDNYIINYLFNLNNPILDFTTMNIKGKFTKENSDLLIQSFKEEKNYKNVIIVPINSISDFQKTIEPKDKNEYEEKNILHHFNKSLNFSVQPFFILIDYYEKDFIIEPHVIEKNFVLSKYYQLKRLGTDFEIVFLININSEDKDKINIFKNIVLTKKKNNDDFDISINGKYFYNISLGNEELIGLEEFLEVFDNKTINSFKITLVLINQNSIFSEELTQYEKLEREITEVTFNYYYLKKENLSLMLNKYNMLDETNFMVLRRKKSPKDELLKYACYYNHFDDILYCEQNSYYSIKINIAVGGLNKSGKSTLINAIFRRKRCPEINGSCLSEYTLKDYALNFIEFSSTSNIMKNFEDKKNEMKKINEDINCFLFCINFEQSFFDDDVDIKNIFDTLFKFEIRTFFVITQSDKPESREYKNFINKVIEIINSIIKNYPQDKAKKVFGDNLEIKFIPVFSKKKRYHGHIIHPFGLDILFDRLYNYFNQKKIIFDKDEINRNYENNNELLKSIFDSKSDFLMRINKKMELQAFNYIFKFIILNPNYLKNITIESLYKIYDYAYYNFLNNYKYIIDLLKEEEKLSIYKVLNGPRMGEDEIKSIIESTEYKEMIDEFKDIKDIINTSFIDFLSSKLSKILVKNLYKIIEENLLIYVKELFKTYNKAIMDLLELKNYFEQFYLEDKNIF